MTLPRQLPIAVLFVTFSSDAPKAEEIGLRLPRFSAQSSHSPGDAIDRVTKRHVNLALIEAWTNPEKLRGVAARIREESVNQSVRVIALVNTAEQAAALQGEPLVDGCVCVLDDVATVQARIRHVLEQPDAVRENGCGMVVGDLTIHAVARRVWANGLDGWRELALQPRTFDVLYALAKHPQEVISRLDLLTEVWGGAQFATERNVDVQVHAVRAAFAEAKTQCTIKSVYDTGYRLQLPGTTTDGVLAVGDLAIDKVRRRVWVMSPAGWRDVHLRPRAYDLLCVFCKAPGRIFAREQLLEAVWGTGTSVVIRNVDVLVGVLRVELGRAMSASTVRTVYGDGYRFDVGRPPISESSAISTGLS